MLDFIIMMIVFSKLDVLHGWVFGLMVVKAIWEVIKLMCICVKAGQEL